MVSNVATGKTHMAHSKNIASYPEVLRNLITTLSNSKEAVSQDFPPIPHKAAIRTRAQFYSLRKLVAERLLEEGNGDTASRVYAISLKVIEVDYNLSKLTITNQHGNFEQSFLSAIEDFNQSMKTPSQQRENSSGVGQLTEEQRRELTASLEAVEQSSVSKELEMVAHTSKYSASNTNPYFAEEAAEPSEEDRKALSEAKARWESDELETKHSKYASPAERKAFKDKE
jgi:hypothetical protein